MFSLVKKINTFLSILDKVSEVSVSGDDIHIKFKGDLLLESNNLFLYSKDGVLVTKHKVCHFNPIFKSNKVDFNLNTTKLIAEDSEEISNREIRMLEEQERLHKLMIEQRDKDI